MCSTELFIWSIPNKECSIKVGFLTGAGVVLDTVAASGNILLLAPRRNVGERDTVGESVTNLEGSHFV